MEGLYRSNGFLDAKVDADIQDNYKKKEGDLFVRFEINEGIQTRVASLNIEGNHAFKDEELQGVVGSLPGQPYSDLSVGSDRRISWRCTSTKVIPGDAAADGGEVTAKNGEASAESQ